MTDTFHYPFDQVLCLSIFDIAEPQGIQGRNRSCPHGKNIAVNPSNTCCSPLKGFNGRGMVMRFNFKYNTISLPDICQSCIFFSRFNQELAAIAGQCLQPLDRILVTAMLTPHD